jgi:hypothetical protein
MSETYICARCGEECEKGEKGWSEEKAIQEMKENFGDIPEEERVIVCDDCFKTLIN